MVSCVKRNLCKSIFLKAQNYQHCFEYTFYSRLHPAYSDKKQKVKMFGIFGQASQILTLLESALQSLTAIVRTTLYEAGL